MKTVNGSFVDAWNLVEALCNVRADSLKYLSIEGELSAHFCFIFDKKLINYVIRMMPGYFIVIFIVDMLNKLHHCITVTKVSNENLEFKMFFLNFPDEVAEKCFHFFNKFVKLNCASVGILVDDVIQFCPWHFLASFVKRPH